MTCDGSNSDSMNRGVFYFFLSLSTHNFSFSNAKLYFVISLNPFSKILGATLVRTATLNYISMFILYKPLWPRHYKRRSFYVGL